MLTSRVIQYIDRWTSWDFTSSHKRVEKKEWQLFEGDSSLFFKLFGLKCHYNFSWSLRRKKSFLDFSINLADIDFQIHLWMHSTNITVENFLMNSTLCTPVFFSRKDIIQTFDIFSYWLQKYQPFKEDKANQLHKSCEWFENPLH